jgi:hypothetical protein
VSARLSASDGDFAIGTEEPLMLNKKGPPGKTLLLLTSVPLLVLLHALTWSWAVRETPVVRATHQIKSIQLTALDDSGTCRGCGPGFVDALTGQVEQLPTDGTVYLALFTFGSVSRNIFAAPLNATTRPLVLRLVKTLPTPRERFTHPNEAVKAMSAEAAKLFAEDPSMQAAWRDGEIGIRATLVWDGQMDVDPQSRTTPSDFESETREFERRYNTPITNLVLTRPNSKKKPSEQPMVPAIRTTNVAEKDLFPVLRAQVDSRLAGPTPSASRRPVVPAWLLWIDAAFACVAAGWLLVRRHRNGDQARQRRLDEYCGEYRYVSGNEAGTFTLRPNTDVVLGSGGHLRSLPATLRIQIDGRGWRTVTVDHGEVRIDGHPLKPRKRYAITELRTITCGKTATTITLQPPRRRQPTPEIAVQLVQGRTA